jgi:hypothetical protein
MVDLTMVLATGDSLPQSDPPRSPRETLPTMYDLPSEFLEEPGLPDEYPWLLLDTEQERLAKAQRRLVLAARTMQATQYLKPSP